MLRKRSAMPAAHNAAAAPTVSARPISPPSSAGLLETYMPASRAIANSIVLTIAARVSAEAT
jgi:hypothetical protein